MGKEVERCKNCKYSLYDDGEGDNSDYSCRRKSPVRVDGYYCGYGKFPTVKEYHWCGEFKQKEEESPPFIGQKEGGSTTKGGI